MSANLAVIAVLLEQMHRHGVDFRKPIQVLDLPAKKQRGVNFGAGKQPSPEPHPIRLDDKQEEA